MWNCTWYTSGQQARTRTEILRIDSHYEYSSRNTSDYKFEMNAIIEMKFFHWKSFPLKRSWNVQDRLIGQPTILYLRGWIHPGWYAQIEHAQVNLALDLCGNPYLDLLLFLFDFDLNSDLNLVSFSAQTARPCDERTALNSRFLS